MDIKKLFQLLFVTLALGLLLGACSADSLDSSTQEIEESTETNTATTSQSDSVDEETAEVIEDDLASEEDSVELGELI